MHASLLNEDLIQPGKLEMGISHRTSGRTRHFDWGRQETTPGWSARTKPQTGSNRLSPDKRLPDNSNLLDNLEVLSRLLSEVSHA
jgi:hypothetical protein